MTNEDAIIRYLLAGKAAGCPADQMVNFARAGIVLHPKQLIASAAARACDSTEGPMDIGFGGARGGGKSFWMLAQIAADDCQRYPGLKCLILRKIGKANRENFADLRQRALMAIPHDYKEREGLVTFDRTKSKIILGHFKDESEIDNYLGLEYDIIGTEEDTTLSLRKKSDIMTCLRSSKPGWRPRRYRTTNPGGISHVSFKKEFIAPWREGREFDTRFIQSLPTDNPSLNPEYVAKILSRLVGWQRRAWLEGDWDIEQGQYFSNFRHEVHVKLNSAVTEVPDAWDVWCALDHGLTHYTVVYLLTKDDDGNIWVLDEHSQRNWVPEQHANAIYGMLERWGLQIDRLKVFVAGHDCFFKKVDGDQIGTIADQYARFGITLTRANIDRVSGALELYRRLGNEGTRTEGEAELRPSLFIREACSHLIECIPSLQRDPKHPEDVLKVDCDPDTGDGGDDPYDCMRMGLMVFAPGPNRSNSSSSVVGPPRDFSTYRVR